MEVWGQGTNRVIAACKRHGAVPPKFEELQEFLNVTFKAQMVAAGETSAQKTTQDFTQKTTQKILNLIAKKSRNNPFDVSGRNTDKRGWY
ncbi:MAG: hypothetical protein HY747_06005 [Elusimicrobia bacterium]|nr:hypothetical protein [Elusimicrobiota bacterium]